MTAFSGQLNNISYASFVEDGSSSRVNDSHLAHRKAEESAARRFTAMTWLQRIGGPLMNLPTEPSEEHLRCCLRSGVVLCNLINKVQPGAIPKVIESVPTSGPLEGVAHSAYQHFENVRNFLVAVEELRLPSFEASDLDMASTTAGSLAKVVDCILSLKSYHELKQHGGQDSQKYVSGLKSHTSLRLNGLEFPAGFMQPTTEETHYLSLKSSLDSSLALRYYFILV